MKNNPFITYIAPIRNESLLIERMIKSIINQKNINFDFEIIVADGMSTDGTRNIINRLMKTVNEIKLIDNPEKIVSTGFNRALSISRGGLYNSYRRTCRISYRLFTELFKRIKNYKC